MKHLCTLFLLLSLAPVELFSQRVVPYGTGASGAFGIYKMIEYQGQLVIGGFYSQFNGHQRWNIQAWDGTQHYDLSGGFEAATSQVRALTMFESDLIATGREPNFGNVARWNGISWSAMGSGVSDRGQALTLFGGELLIGDRSGRVSRWNGSDWDQLGDVFNGEVTALAELNGSLYAGGWFTSNSGGEVLRRVARWNGAAWEQVGAGLNNDVIAMITTTDGLVLAGSFTSDGDSALVIPGWTRSDGNGFSEETMVPNNGEISGVCTYPGDGFVVCGFGEALHFGMNGVTNIPFTQGRDMIAYGSDVLIAGRGTASDSWSYTQQIGRVITGKYRETLDANSVAAQLTPTPCVFNGISGSGFEVPSGAGTGTFYTVQPMLVGYRDGSFCSSSDPFDGLSNYEAAYPQSGPRGDLMDDAFMDHYFQVWKLDRATIEAHISNWDQAGYQVPEAISSWPGNGDPSNGEPLRIAPFADLDGDDLYEPETGEYPLIRGDQALFHVLHTSVVEPVAPPLLEADMSIMTYSFLASGNPALDHTVFMSVKVFNRSTSAYTGVRFGLFADIDIGCPNEDLVGCDSTRSLFFGYNASDLDPDCIGTIGYSAQPPAEGVKFLNREMTSHREWNHEGPIFNLEDFLQGTFQGQPFQELGYPTNFQYPGGAFVDHQIGFNDIRSVGAAGPFNFASGDTLCFDLAFIYARASSGGAYASVDALKLRSDSVQAFYDAQWFDCSSDVDLFSAIKTENTKSGFRLYPNPTRDSFVIERVSGSGAGKFTIHAVTGALVQQGIMGVGATRTTVDMKTVRSGMYLVEVQSADGVTVQRIEIE